jgi:hypothetical protein
VPFYSDYKIMNDTCVSIRKKKGKKQIPLNGIHQLLHEIDIARNRSVQP